MTADQRERSQTTATLLAAAGIPVPTAEIDAIARMQQSADEARQTLRALRLLETEPVITFSPHNMGEDDDREES